jgi:hypothetical protein
MKEKKIFGLLTIIAALSMLSLTVVIGMQSIMASSFLIKSAIFNLCILISLSGFFLLTTYGNPPVKIKIGIYIYGAVLALIGGLVSFDIIDFVAYWNILIGLYVLYITIIQLQLLKWEKSRSLLKLFGLLMLLSNLFIIIFFLAKLSMSPLSLVLDIAVVISIFSFLIGLMISSGHTEKSLSNN